MAKTFLASFRMLLNSYSGLQLNKIYIRYNININQLIYRLNKNNFDDKFVQETIYNLYYLHDYTNEQDTHHVSIDRSTYDLLH